MKTAVITGGSGAIGKALVSEFAADHRVLFTYCKNYEKACEIAEKYSAEPVKCDLTVFDDIENLKNSLTSCDLLINNAGISKSVFFTDMSDKEMLEIINTDLIGTMRITKAILPFMLARKKGAVINISSVWGVYGGSCETAYSAAKAGIIGFTKALSREVGLCGIRVNCIAPGLIESDMNAHLSDDEVSDFVSETSLARIGKPTDIAKAARYLSEADFVTGQVLGADGGF